MKIISAALFLASLLAVGTLLASSPGTPARPPIDEPTVAALVAQLGSDRFDTRESATKTLLSMGPAVRPFLTHATSNDTETKARLAEILASIGLWDGKQSIKEFAQSWALEPTITLPLGKRKVPLELALIPSGKFLMGSPVGEIDRRSDETQHPVTISKPYYMGTAHVTVEQFAAFVDDTGYQTVAEKRGASGCFVYRNGFDAVQVQGASWKKPQYPQTGDHPVAQIGWDDAKAFCAWLGQQTGRKIALPTEAQWEFAARAGTQTIYLWGDAHATGEKIANVSDRNLQKNANPPAPGWEAFPWDDGFAYTSPVKTYKPNAFGLYDMVGNLWQWCDDAPAKYGTEPVVDPVGAGTGHVQRGASWCGRPFVSRIAYRNPHEATYITDAIGFRIAMTIDPPQ